MRFWFDTEFIENGADSPLDLISIGIVSEAGPTLYLENAEADLSKANPFVREYVIPKLRRDDVCVSRRKMALRIYAFVNELCVYEAREKLATAEVPPPEFWAYYADYDWVLLAQLFGTMKDLPDGWPMFCLDVKQEAHRLGVPSSQLPAQDQTSAHDALVDALWTRQAWEYLRDLDQLGPRA